MENEAKSVTQEPGDEQLKEAIRSGLERGKQQAAPRRRRRLSIGIAAALIGLMALTAGAAKVSPAFAEALQRIPSFGAFLKLIGENPALLSSIDRDLLQPVGQTIEKDGKRLTVEALIADDRRLVIFYSTSMTQGYDSGLRFDLLDENGTPLNGIVMTNHASIGKTYLEPRGNEDYIDLLLEQGAQLPANVRLRAKHHGTVMNFDLTIDHSRFAGMTRNYEINQTIEIEGQKLTVVRARQTPLQMELIVRKDKSNTKQIKGLINLRLQDETGRDWRSAIGLTGDEMSLFFQNGYFQTPKQLTLLADGFFMFDKGQKVVLDLDQGVVLEAPDERLLLDSIDPFYKREGSGSANLAVSLTNLDEVEQLWAAYNIFSNEFTDAAGNTHSFAVADGDIASYTSNDNSRKMYYSLERKKYPQPLTFTVEDYPGYALMPIEIELIPN
ncbi:DUF4179 domain-containing protein [Paenibacillus pasadenensis]|uniref:DUF4179 domain-containing protein n=1 Tax=Paenibacillus pasadenensis TaxID=217090 RepID=UPI00203FE579|nr:DUF4179 domain-containing protein [Paenibacillus pasadenensis]MCM3749199.1 DUF4179 domain-containing protein [Paenibacillus pasadenensis]